MIQNLLCALALTVLPPQNETVYTNANLTFPHYYFENEKKTVYFNDIANAKQAPQSASLTLKQFKKGDEVTLIGTNAFNYWKISDQGNTYYVLKDTLSEEAPFTWDGPVLNPSSGTVTGPLGKETYYNLDMSGVVSHMKGLGYEHEYWIREDGVKMLGDYVMVAANLNMHPKGSIIPTSLGMAIVCDTGGFAHSNPNQIDVAVNW